MDFQQIYMTLYPIFNDVIVPDKTVSWWGKKVQLISLTHLGINLIILLSELTLKISNVLLPVLTADTKLFHVYYRWQRWKISLCKIWYTIPVAEMQVGFSWVRLPFSASFAEGRYFLEETQMHSHSKFKCYFAPSASQTVKEMSTFLHHLKLTIFMWFSPNFFSQKAVKEVKKILCNL